jgi:hypothetical protein
MTIVEWMMVNLAVMIRKHLEYQAQLSKITDVFADVDDVVTTLSVISALPIDSLKVVAPNGEFYTIDEYEVADKFERMCKARGVTIDDSDYSLDLRADSINAFPVVYSEEEAKKVKKGEPVISNVTGMIVPQWLLSYPVQMRNKYVPLTPAEFKSAQIRIVNTVKGKINRWTSVKELTNPVLLTSVKVIGYEDSSTGFHMVSAPDEDWSTLPTVLTIGGQLYKSYKFNLPLEDYVDKFAYHLVSDMSR